ncbi:phenylalanine--tRNA ligase subunit alpha [Theileria parva strain Muguga]|uniref:phenylalanine--tRNA ligase n=1 Tax=Theileria parva TaxID=5875 RepID=Q4N1V5_THEPA|nr:phenylalanyl-tRNA synthetase subunit alpha [Theileria parva strain Muguga]EAN31974.1 phenylalanine--tRNA ligase subunit alpha [Theileria parva strain Muguga]|eukprot:XP_764257.1 phenylalanyl-tRNA synthetase subunit alpha [Theileria parva strain Muguga]
MCSKEEELNLLLSKLDLAFEKHSKKNEFNDSKPFVSTFDVEYDHDKVLSGVKSLMSKGYLTLEENKSNTYMLTKEGEKYSKNNSPEYILVQKVKESNVLTVDEALKSVENADIGLKKCMKNKYLKLEDKVLSLGLNSLDSDLTQSLLLVVGNYGKCEPSMMLELSKLIPDKKKLDEELGDLKKRKLVTSRITVCYNVRKTDEYKSSVRPQITDLTMELLESGKWEEAEIKKYNFFSSGKKALNGDLHPLIHTMQEFRRILISMGFEELDTSRYLESSFWCFDSLYIPQQHPARDIQDTFFLDNPEKIDPKFLDEAHVKNVSVAHGDARVYNSFGWQYNWDLDESLKTILRTHVTPCTARKLKQMADDYQKGKPIVPCKFFAIDKVFRNEATDSTHLCEFHQIEGFVVGFDLGLGDLMGVMETFYGAIGIDPLRFKPAFNPYTEPSMEIFGFHKSLNTWIEVGNSGIFRPEMLLPMGLPENLTVIAWGLSLERPTMLSHNIKNIRDLIGCKY